MPAHSTEILNRTIRLLIDSHLAYLKALEMSDDDHRLVEAFRNRSAERQKLIAELQGLVRASNETPAEEGSAIGTLNRGFEDFLDLFRDNEKAALENLKQGEEDVAAKIEEELGNAELTDEERRLMERAVRAAREGSEFVDHRLAAVQTA